MAYTEADITRVTGQIPDYLESTALDPITPGHKRSIAVTLCENGVTNIPGQRAKSWSYNAATQTFTGPSGATYRAGFVGLVSGEWTGYWAEVV